MNGLNHSQVHLINELTMETADTDSSFRMNEETYLKFLELVTPRIQENLIGLRKGVTSYELLSAALSCLASRTLCKHDVLSSRFTTGPLKKYT